MIVELRPDSFHRIVPLCRASEVCFPLISAVAQTKQRGQVFADKAENPGCAVVITNFGFMSFLGISPNDAFDTGLVQVLATRGALRPSYILWYSPPEYWQRKLDLLGSESARRRERVRFQFAEDWPAHRRDPFQCPVGFEIRDLDTDLIRKSDKLGVDIGSRFWSSPADFSANGLGVCAVRGDEVVSVCYAATISDGIAEVDVLTHPEFRGRGLGHHLAHVFIRKCMDKGISPTWDCFVSNVASIKLAEKLGFVRMSNYFLYSFDVPIEIRASRPGAPKS